MKIEKKSVASIRASFKNTSMDSFMAEDVEVEVDESFIIVTGGQKSKYIAISALASFLIVDYTEKPSDSHTE